MSAPINMQRSLERFFNSALDCQVLNGYLKLTLNPKVLTISPSQAVRRLEKQSVVLNVAIVISLLAIATFINLGQLHLLPLNIYMINMAALGSLLIIELILRIVCRVHIKKAQANVEKACNANVRELLNSICPLYTPLVVLKNDSLIPVNKGLHAVKMKERYSKIDIATGNAIFKKVVENKISILKPNLSPIKIHEIVTSLLTRDCYLISL